MATEETEARPARPDELEPRWLDACRRMVAEMGRLFAACSTVAERTVYEGVGEGGDRSLQLDRLCEEVVFAELARLHSEERLDFRVISEERGEVAFGDRADGHVVIVDPIDGSLNARRTIPAFSLSIAFATGPTMADVELAFVHDFGPGEEFTARRGGGAKLGDRTIEARGPGHGLEVVAIEAAKPERVLAVARELSGSAFRLRSIGSIAITVCWIAAGRFDGMLTTRPCRSVDVAAGQLIAREAGAIIAFPGLALDGAGLDLDARYQVVSALDPELMEPLLGALRAVEAERAG
jgi:myo-inositol-1(or 4)-monophosphatase